MGSFKDYNTSVGLFSRLLYKTVARDGDMKLVVSTGLEKNLKPIEKAHSPNSVYVVLTKELDIKNINVFDGTGNKLKQIDLDHSHNGLKEHVHNFEKGDKYHPKKGVPLSSEDWELVAKAEKILKEYKS